MERSRLLVARRECFDDGSQGADLNDFSVKNHISSMLREWGGPVMRLTPKEQLIIREAINAADTEALIYLFGSRTDDSGKGGDVDLLVLSKKIDLMAKLGVLAQLHQILGERKIDLVVYPDASRPFTRMVMEESVPL